MTESDAAGEDRNGPSPRQRRRPRLRRATLGGACRRLTVVSFAALCLAVAVVGGVAVVAESISTWTWYFRMERTVALATPLVVGLLAVTLGGAMGSVMFTDDWD